MISLGTRLDLDMFLVLFSVNVAYHEMQTKTRADMTCALYKMVGPIRQSSLAQKAATQKILGSQGRGTFDRPTTTYYCSYR